MTLTDLRKTPFPWFGGKADAAPAVWDALGDVDHYCEPFAGSLAVLLRRPHPCNRTYYSETVNDLDGLLCNAWRAIAADPDGVAEAASWPVCEADLHARHLALLRWREERQLEHLMGDPAFCDIRMAGWWLWGQSAWIGGGWCSGDGPWIVGDDGRIEKRKGSRGVGRQLPHLGDDGRGVHHAGLREPGVSAEEEYHPMTMPELRRWMRFLSARLRHVRILNGDWARLTTSGALQSLPVRQGGHAGVFLDPPYSHDVRASALYAHESATVADDVRAWCLENGGNPRYRIVLAGYAAEHGALEAAGWRSVAWYRGGFLRGGYANQGEGGTQQDQERLWLSPHCLGAVKESPQMGLFA
jgi:DNA adenine methylase